MSRTVIRQLFAFAATGIANTAVGLAVIFAAMIVFSVPPIPANLLGYLVGLCVSFMLNRFWTFRDQASGMPVAQFILAFAIAYLANLTILQGVIMLRPQWALAAQVLALGTYSLVFFIICRVFVFKAPIKAAEDKTR